MGLPHDSKAYLRSNTPDIEPSRSNSYTNSHYPQDYTPSLPRRRSAPSPSRSPWTPSAKMSNPTDSAVTRGSNFPPAGIAVGMLELLVYYPNHFNVAGVVERATREGWSAPLMSRVQLWARGACTKQHYERRNETVRQQISVAFRQSGTTMTAFRASLAGRPFDNTDGPQFSSLYDVSNIVPGPLASGPPFLHQLLNGVVNHPTGADAGQLTKALLFAQSQGNAYLSGLTTDDLPAIIAQQNLRSPNDAGTPDWDKRARERAEILVPKP
ncbi:hypothetical protein BST61_g1111 [Cercospora zeina]